MSKDDGKFLLMIHTNKNQFLWCKSKDDVQILCELDKLSKTGTK